MSWETRPTTIPPTTSRGWRDRHIFYKVLTVCPSPLFCNRASPLAKYWQKIFLHVLFLLTRGQEQSPPVLSLSTRGQQSPGSEIRHIICMRAHESSASGSFAAAAPPPPSHELVGGLKNIRVCVQIFYSTAPPRGPPLYRRKADVIFILKVFLLPVCPPVWGHIALVIMNYANFISSAALCHRAGRLARCCCWEVFALWARFRFGISGYSSRFSMWDCVLNRETQSEKQRERDLNWGTRFCAPGKKYYYFVFGIFTLTANIFRRCFESQKRDNLTLQTQLFDCAFYP